MTLDFEEKFFEEEEREGFLIPAMMKRVWAAEMKVLSDILRVARWHGLTCYAAFGTLLGAVRHQGFVPWDDDIDIFLKRSDYLKLFALLARELPDTYRIMSPYVGDMNHQPQGCVMNRHLPDLGRAEDKELTERFYGCPYIIGVDVFPLDDIPTNPEEKELHQLLYGSVYDTAQRYDELEQNGELPRKLELISDATGQRFDFHGEESVKLQLWRLADRIAMMYLGEGGKEIACMKLTAMHGESAYYPVSWFESTVELPFERTTVPAPIGYASFLAANYGPDYMTPVQYAAGHDYPFYQEQDEMIKTLKARQT